MWRCRGGGQGPKPHRDRMRALRVVLHRPVGRAWAVLDGQLQGQRSRMAGQGRAAWGCRQSSKTTKAEAGGLRVRGTRIAAKQHEGKLSSEGVPRGPGAKAAAGVSRLVLYRPAGRLGGERGGGAGRWAPEARVASGRKGTSDAPCFIGRCRAVWRSGRGARAAGSRGCWGQGVSAG